MPYNPHIQDRSGELYAQGISQAGRSIGRGIDKYGDRRREQKEKAKRDAGFQKGLEGIQEHAPDLYKEYFGDQSPQELGVNQINAMLKFHDLRAADIGYKQAVYDLEQDKKWNEKGPQVRTDEKTGRRYFTDNNGQVLFIDEEASTVTPADWEPRTWGVGADAAGGTLYEREPGKVFHARPNSGGQGGWENDPYVRDMLRPSSGGEKRVQEKAAKLASLKGRLAAIDETRRQRQGSKMHPRLESIARRLQRDIASLEAELVSLGGNPTDAAPRGRRSVADEFFGGE